MIDWHCHILPGLDDGAYDNTPATVGAAMAKSQTALDQVGIKLQLHPGMEYYLDEYFQEALADPQPLGTSKMLLVEAPAQANIELIKENIFLVVRQGFTPLFAHRERHAWLAPKPLRQRNLLDKIRGLLSRVSGAPSNSESQSLNRELLDLQALCGPFQGNIGSFSGQYGREVKERAKQLHHRKHYHCFGSDGHRPEPMRQALQRGLDKLAAIPAVTAD